MRLQINQKQQITEGVTVAAIFVFLIVFGSGIFYYGESLILPPQVIAVAIMPP
jgi:hypothetical protein